MDSAGLSQGQLNVLRDGLTDEVSLWSALLDMELTVPGRDRIEPHEVEEAIQMLQGLVRAGLITAGHTDFREGGPGRVAEDPEVVWNRIRTDCASGDWADWAYTAWFFNTTHGDKVARSLGDAS